MIFPLKNEIKPSDIYKKLQFLNQRFLAIASPSFISTLENT